MKQSAIIKAYKSICKLSQLDLPIRLAFDLFKVKMVLQPQWDFQIEEETKAASTAKPLENGQYEFPTTEGANAFREKMQEIGQIEVDMKFPKVRIPLSIPGLKLSVEDIEALKDFVTFE